MPHVQCCGVVSGRVGLCSSVPATGALDPLMALFVPFMEGVGAPVDGWERVAGRPSQPFFFLPSILLFFAVSFFTSRGPPPPLCHNAARLPIPTFLTSMVDSHYCRGTRDLPPLPPFRFISLPPLVPSRAGHTCRGTARHKKTERQPTPTQQACQAPRLPVLPPPTTPCAKCVPTRGAAAAVGTSPHCSAHSCRANRDMV